MFELIAYRQHMVAAGRRPATINRRPLRRLCRWARSTGTLIGYMRVSASGDRQVLDLQRDAFVAACVTTGHLYEDLASRRRDDRPGLPSCVKALRQGDTLVVWKPDRLGRDLRHLVNLAHELTQRGIGLKALAGEGERDRHLNGDRQVGVWHLCLTR